MEDEYTDNDVDDNHDNHDDEEEDDDEDTLLFFLMSEPRKRYNNSRWEKALVKHAWKRLAMHHAPRIIQSKTRNRKGHKIGRGHASSVLRFGKKGMRISTTGK